LRRAWLLVALGLSWRVALPAGDAPAPIQREIVGLERAWSAAFLAHDLDKISELLADDFVGIDGRGVVSDKAAELAEAKAPDSGSTAPVLIGEDLSEIRVRAWNGDAAVLTAINTVRFSSREGESTIRYRRTTVWVRGDGRWQCVSFHGSRIVSPS
jgi:ketosteroid isomerase-like protein